jgi:uncharacterized protein with ATP-grasp and redox domains
MGKTDFSSISKKIRSVEKELTKNLVKRKLKHDNQPIPEEKVLNEASEQIVDRAHKVLKKGTKSFFSELKQAKKEFLKAYRDMDDKNE